MRQKQRPEKETAETVVKEIRRATRKHYSAEEKIRIVLEGLRGEDSIAELCRREGIPPNVSYRWSKDFLEAGKKGPASTATKIKAYLVGFSLGGVIAQHFALAYPERLKSLVLLRTVADRTPEERARILNRADVIKAEGISTCLLYTSDAADEL